MPPQFNKISLKVRLILIKRRWQSRFFSLIRCNFHLQEFHFLRNVRWMFALVAACQTSITCISLLLIYFGHRWWYFDTNKEGTGLYKEYYKLKRCSKKECCKQSRCVKFKVTMTKWPVQKPTHSTTQKHVEHKNATDILKKTHYFLCFSDTSFFIHLTVISQTLLLSIF